MGVKNAGKQVGDQIEMNNDMKAIMENWNLYLLEEEIQQLCENQEILEEGIKDLAAKLAKKYALPAMIVLQMLNAAAPAMAQHSAEAPVSKEVPVQTTTRKSTVVDKTLKIVNSWGKYSTAKAKGEEVEASLKELIGVLQSFDVPKEAAIKIIKAPTQAEVEKIVDSL